MAAEADQNNELYEFGPFRVDPDKQTLCRHGEAVPLTPKTFQILLVLIRNNKEVVAKDDLMKVVWPDTFVEESNLSRNIFLLRKALGETAQDHRYIVTVPNRGYRLAENVRLISRQDLTVIAASHSTMKVEVSESHGWRWVAVAVAFLAAAGVGQWWRTSHRQFVLNPKDTIVLADFNNATGDPMLDETLRRGLAIQLEQSPLLSLVSDQRISHALRLMGQKADTPVTPQMARDVCERTGATAVLDGSLKPIGSEYVLELQAKNCQTDEVLDREQAQATKKEDVLNALDQVATRFRERFGESLSTIRQHNTPLAEATTPSLEALKAYSAGWKLHTSNGAMAALPFMRRAVDIDPNFALAHSTLGREYADIDEFDLAAESATKAWQLRERTSDREKFFITATYHILATGNLEQARQALQAWSQAYPRDALPHTMLSGYPNKAAGRYAQAITEAQKAIECDPDIAIAYFNLAVNNVFLNRLDEAETALRRATGRGLEIDEYIMLEHDLAFMKGDVQGMKRTAIRGRERLGGDSWISNKEAYVKAYSGHLQQARMLTRQAIDEAAQEGQKERSALWQAGAALREALLGNRIEARANAISALAFSRSPEVEYGAALSLAIAGDEPHAQTLIEDLGRRFPENSSVRFSYLPVLRAQMALKEGDAAGAIDKLQPASLSELGASHELLGALYPIYLRGEAYLALRQGVAASLEFQKILDHFGIVGSDPIGALASLQLGRAYLLSGEIARGRTAYESFLKIWGDGDPNIPVLKEARAEFLKLK